MSADFIERRKAEIKSMGLQRLAYAEEYAALSELESLRAQRDKLAAALRQLNHMGGDERGGYCICPRNDGSAPDHEHASGCADARAALAKLDGGAK